MRRLLEQCVFQPEEIAIMIAAYERAARELTLSLGESHAKKEQIAAVVIEIAQTGERDASTIAEKTILRLHR